MADSKYYTLSEGNKDSNFKDVVEFVLTPKDRMSLCRQQHRCVDAGETGRRAGVAAGCSSLRHWLICRAKERPSGKHRLHDSAFLVLIVLEGWFMQRRLGMYLASFLNKAGKKTPVLQRVSTVGPESGSADTARDVHGWAMKLYTDEGNLDWVFNNTVGRLPYSE
ncbi:hypothetical protein N7470_001863 [Penicillium chermesinum]|nr:hypothetical protein N7470_001863 [Penicillium chermesinum]